MLNDWSHKVRAILKEYCQGNIKKLLPSLSQSGNIRFYFGQQKLCMDNNQGSRLSLSVLQCQHLLTFEGQGSDNCGRERKLLRTAARCSACVRLDSKLEPRTVPRVNAFNIYVALNI